VREAEFSTNYTMAAPNPTHLDRAPHPTNLGHDQKCGSLPPHKLKLMESESITRRIYPNNGVIRQENRLGGSDEDCFDIWCWICSRMPSRIVLLGDFCTGRYDCHSGSCHGMRSKANKGVSRLQRLEAIDPALYQSLWEEGVSQKVVWPASRFSW
jgi:hypothetical protein